MTIRALIAHLQQIERKHGPTMQVYYQTGTFPRDLRLDVGDDGTLRIGDGETDTREKRL